MATVQQFKAALVAILDSDATLRTVLGRTTKLALPAGNLEIDPAIPVIVYKLAGQDAVSTTIDFRFACVAPLQATADAACDRLAYLFNTAGVTLQLFAARSIDACGNPSRRPSREEPDHDQESPSTACRADLLCSFLFS